MERRQRAGQDHQRGARDAGYAFAGEHEGQHHQQLLAEREVYAGGLRHKNGGQREVQRASIQVEAVAGGEHEAHDVLGYSKPLHVLQCEGQGSLARRGGEGDQERLAHGAVEGGEGDAGDGQHRSEHHHHEDKERGVHGQDQLAQAKQHAQSFAPHRDRQRGANAQRRQDHHVARVAEHDLGQRGTELDYRLRLGAHGRAGGTEQESENYDLEGVVASHGIDDAGGDNVLQQRIQIGRRGWNGRFGRGALDGNAHSGANQVHGAQAQEQRGGGDDFEIDDGFGADAAHALQVAAAGHARHQRAEQQGRDDGADQAEENVGHRPQLLGGSRRDDAESHARRHSDENPRGERNPLHRSPHFSLERSTSKNRMWGGRTSRSESRELRHTRSSPSLMGLPTWPSMVRYTPSSGPRETTR